MLITLKKDFIDLFVESGAGREKEKERNINVREKHPSVASHTPPTGDLAGNPACAMTGNRTGNLWLTEGHPIH